MQNDTWCMYLEDERGRLHFSLSIKSNLVSPASCTLTPLEMGYTLIFVYFERCWFLLDNVIVGMYYVSCYTFNHISKEYVSFIKAKTNMRMYEVSLKKHIYNDACMLHLL